MPKGDRDVVRVILACGHNRKVNKDLTDIHDPQTKLYCLSCDNHHPIVGRAKLYSRLK